MSNAFSFSGIKSVSSLTESSIKYNASNPPVIKEADKVFKQICSSPSPDIGSRVLDKIEKILQVMKTTSPSSLDKLWEKLEREVNGGRKLSTRYSAVEEKLNLTVGLFHAGLNQIEEGDSMESLIYMYGLFKEGSKCASSKLFQNMSSSSQNSINQTLQFINRRFKEAFSIFNDRIDRKEIRGNKFKPPLSNL